jgi:hypothetical protein
MLQKLCQIVIPKSYESGLSPTVSSTQLPDDSALRWDGIESTFDPNSRAETILLGCSDATDKFAEWSRFR